MQTVLWSLLGIVAGACIAVQAPINADLARGLGSAVAAAAASFLAGAVALAGLTAASGIAAGAWPQFGAPRPWLYVVGGLLGSIYVTTVILLAPRIGVAAVMGLAIAGQLLAGVLLDRIGFMGLPVHEITAGRAVGGLLLIAGALMIRLA
jgi:transporter family-2 protein